MSTFYLIPPAAAGPTQAERLGWNLLGRGITRLHSSALEAALESAAPIARALEIRLEVREGLGEAARIVTEMECLEARYRGETVAVVTSGDAIRAALVHYLGMPAEFSDRIEISPASFSVVVINETGPRILKLNETIE